MPRQFRKQKPYIVVFCEGETAHDQRVHRILANVAL